ncbi:MAG: ABC transporter permease subunit [Beijerinckiaceae bacterium]|nr:ABC transporter permease subunit [Beijerinckiaceae bacterium]
MTNMTVGDKPKISPFYDPKVRGLFFQVLMLALVALGVFIAYRNAVEGLRRQGVVSSLGFWDSVAGFPISFKLIPFTELSTYGTAFWVGLINTLFVSAIGIVLATILGFIIGVARLSTNWLVSKLAYWYVQIIRNIPLLIQLILIADILQHLPNTNELKENSLGIYLSNKGLFTPQPDFLGGSQYIFYALLAGLALFIAVYYWAKDRQTKTGQQTPLLPIFLGLVFGLPLVAFFATGMPVQMQYPVKTRFGFQGDATLQLEFVAALVGLVVYTAAFIAEVVRAGIISVSKGQTEAAGALGLSPSQSLKLVIVPQAMRVILPPLTNQYLNLTKNSTLASVIAFPELVQVFTGTVLNQTNQAIPIMGVTMLVYLTISLITSFLMNNFNKRMALRER